MSTKTVVSSDRKQELTTLIRRLPAMLAGNVQDEYGVAAGFRARIANTFFSLVAPNFQRLGRGQPGADGDVWAPLSPEYLAYGRPVTGTKPPRGGKLAPGGKDGLLTGQQLALWNRTFRQALSHYIVFQPEEEAKSHAAAVAWIAVKKAGGKTKLGTFGARQVGVDYQTLVSHGDLRTSLKFGEVLEKIGPDAEYRPPRGQHYEEQAYRLVVGSDDPKAKFHHHGKGRRRRRLWPERFPADWWNQILGQAMGGLTRIADLFRSGQL